MVTLAGALAALVVLLLWLAGSVSRRLAHTLRRLQISAAARERLGEQLRDARDRLRWHETEVRAVGRRLVAAEDALHWHQWWLRNACEGTPLDAWRPHLIRLALASLLAPDMATFARDLHSIEADESRPLEERAAARGILAELGAERPPWDPSLRPAGKPEFSAHRVREAYVHALTSWMHLLAPLPVAEPRPTPPDAH